jgi:hypothetical protein
LPRPDWSRPGRGPLTIPDILTLEALADVRALIEKHLLAEYRGPSAFLTAQCVFEGNRTTPWSPKVTE